MSASDRPVPAGRPLVGIGVPVYNGEPFLRDTLDSLLAQDYALLDIVVSDNASTDGTEQICREFARVDSRVRYQRATHNHGAVWNFNHVARLAHGSYFMWAGAHDLWHPTYVSRCVELLESSPGLAVAYAHARQIDEGGRTVNERMADEADTRALSPLARYGLVTWHVRVCNVIHGVIRRSTLDGTSMMQNVWCPDHLLIAELALLGEFAQVEDVLFYRRRVRAAESCEEFKVRVAEQLDPSIAEEWLSVPAVALYRELRDAHLRLLGRQRLPRALRLSAEVSTIAAFCCRFQVPCTGLAWLDRLLDFGLHRFRLRRIFE
jgi:glycosyltransferase involved in cell wall biosynthesis